MSARFRHAARNATIAGAALSAAGAALRLAGVVDWSWWWIAGPAGTTAVVWLALILVGGLVVRGMARHAAEFP